MIHDYLAFRDRFAAALDPNWESIEWLDHKVGEGGVKLWVEGETALLTEVQPTPSGAILFGLVCAGDMDALLHEIQPALEQYARDRGCSGIAFCGRPGWGRVMAGHGYKTVQIIACKDIT